MKKSMLIRFLLFCMVLSSGGLIHCAGQQANPAPFRAILYKKLGAPCDLQGKECIISLVCKPTDLETDRCVDPATSNQVREKNILACRAMTPVDRGNNVICYDVNPADPPPLRLLLQVPLPESDS